ncbi:MAG: hypothetical protein ACOYOP_15520 [Microthrixaceae bacterium]
MAVAAVIVLLSGAAVAGWVGSRPSGGDFCERLASAPAVADATGHATPVPALTAQAATLRDAADVAPTASIAEAARTVADYRTALAGRLAGTTAAPGLVADVAALDDGADDVAATRTLDAASERYCDVG